MNHGVAPVTFEPVAIASQAYEALRSDETFYFPLAQISFGTGTLAITLTGEETTRAKALGLINRRYAWRGYGADHQLAGHSHETTFIAQYNDALIGTITLAADSAHGLNVDETFPEEMQFFRRKQSTRLCELKKFAFEGDAPAKPVLASLFHFTFMYGINTHLSTDLMIEVNPRHALFYERMLGFKRVGDIRTNASVEAPSQLMWLPVSEIAAALQRRNSGQVDGTLYRYFYSQQFEDRIVDQLNERGLREASIF